MTRKNWKVQIQVLKVMQRILMLKIYMAQKKDYMIEHISMRKMENIFIV